MLKKFKITVNGRAYDVVVEEEGNAAHSGSVAHPVAVAQAPAAPAPVAVAAAPAPVAAPVAAIAAGEGDVVAPLAGVVDSIDVRIGQAVQAGDRVAVIEAMKMKTEAITKVGGTVKAILVKPAESVSTGQVIISIG
ncbi:MAG TPA: biotin/lipoyl-containing protein [Rhodopseudomonas sp.]|uniref:biotin/lipoyl-containing protein n=1 Tax=Rhodopseudomonas sp. TaxID=1078 RepID=UPI002EDAA303